MVVENLTIVVCAVVIILSFLTPLLNPFFRRPSSGNCEMNSIDNVPKLSVIIIARGKAKLLDENLPLFLTQDYPSEYEVIVVTDENDTDSEDILKKYSGNCRLYTTFTPDTSRYMGTRKLAVTLGVKAARHEWVVLTNIECRPISDEWLMHVGKSCKEDKNLILGYVKLSDDTKPYFRFQRVVNACYQFRLAQQRTAFRTECKNIAFRKSVFMRQNGYQGNLKYIYGEYDFLVNKYAKKYSTEVLLNPDSWMVEHNPTKSKWKNECMCYVETRKHLQRTLIPRLTFDLDQVALHLNYIILIASIIFGIIFQNWLVFAISAIALVVTIVLRITFARKAMRQFGEHITLWKIPFYEIGIIWNNIGYRFLYARTDKYDFICHKL